MNAFHAGVDFLRQWPMTEQLGRVLLHSLWQDAAIAAALALILYGMRSVSAGARYFVACAGLGLMLILPIITVVATSEAQTAEIAANSPRASSSAHIAIVQPAPGVVSNNTPIASSMIGAHAPA